MESSFSSEEINALRAVFALYDEKGNGEVETVHLKEIFQKIGRSELYADTALNELGDQTQLTFQEFIQVLENLPEDSGLCSGPDPKVVEFITILEEYRTKCEQDGNYLEAQRADAQLTTLRKQEAKRQSKSLRAKQIAERQDVQIAHNMQYTDFNKAWDQYMEEYDTMAQNYIQQMQEKHRGDLKEFQENLHREIMDRPPKFTKELIEWRRRQHMLARQKNYTEAQKIKKIADAMEEKERSRMHDDYKTIFTRRETKFRQQQQAELHALLKRVDGRRKEHIKQRNLDSKRLLQRNRNVQTVLESRQASETVKKIANIKSTLMGKDRSGANVRSSKNSSIPPEARVVRAKKLTSS